VIPARPLLPGNSGPFERAAADALSDTLPVPIAQIMDPETTPTAFLPFLAAHESVDLWFDDWTLARRRQMVAEAVELAALKGTRKGLRRLLAYVDAEVTWLIAHPARFAFGRSAIAARPIAHPPMVAHYIVRVPLDRPANTFQVGRAVLGRSAMTRVGLEPLRRARIAMATAKDPATLYSVNFAHRRRIRFGDAVPMDGSATFGGFIHRPRL